MKCQLARIITIHPPAILVPIVIDRENVIKSIDLHVIRLFFLARYDNIDSPSSYRPLNPHHHHHHHHRRPLSPVSVGDVCNRISKVSFDNHQSLSGTRIRNRSAEPRHLDKPHDTRPPSVNAIRSVVPDRLQQDQIPICSRPDSGGTKGQTMTLYTNHFKCNLPDNLAIVSLMPFPL